jgi:hypothetical protein
MSDTEFGDTMNKTPPHRMLGGPALEMLAHLAAQGDPPVDYRRRDCAVGYESVRIEGVVAGGDVGIRDHRSAQTDQELVVHGLDPAYAPGVLGGRLQVRVGVDSPGEGYSPVAGLDHDASVVEHRVPIDVVFDIHLQQIVWLTYLYSSCPFHRQS